MNVYFPLIVLAASLTAAAADDLPNYAEFDQTPGRGWRAFADQKQFTEAARSIQNYLTQHNDLTPRERANLHFHAAQCLAFEGSPKSVATALVHLQDARVNPEPPDSPVRWNDYVAATEAFLKRDLSALKAAREQIADGPKSNGEVANLDVVDRLVAKFGKSYAVAYLDDSKEKDESARRLMLLKKTIDNVEITMGKDGTDKLVRVDEPIQRWSNPLVRIVDATVFLWTRDGRPAVVSQVADVTDEGVWQEFQSLTTEPLRGSRDGQSYWAPTAAGIKWERAPTTEAPAATAELRRVQMRKIAEKFRVADLFEFKEPNQLRLLATPLYRYSALKAGVRDGALFSYALGTDPEVLLLIEAQQEGDAESWKVAFARLTGFACRATLDDKEVWSCKVMPFPYPPDSTFFSVRVAPPIRGQ